MMGYRAFLSNFLTQPEDSLQNFRIRLPTTLKTLNTILLLCSSLRIKSALKGAFYRLAEICVPLSLSPSTFPCFKCPRVCALRRNR